MTDEAPRPLERAAEDESKPAPRGQSRALAGGVLLLATLGAVIVVSFSTSSTSPRGGVERDSARSSRMVPTDEQIPDPDVATPVITQRTHGASPFDPPTTDSAVTGCMDLVRGAVGEGVEIQPAEPAWGDIDPTKGRTDSLIYEGVAGSRVWHCAAAKRGDGAVERIDTAIEQIWDGTPPRFEAVHAVTVAAEETCFRRAKTLYPGFVFRGVTREQRGDSLFVTADAIPIENDLVRNFSCVATVRAGGVWSATAKRSR